MLKPMNVNGWNAPKASNIIGKREKPPLPIPIRIGLEQTQRDWSLRQESDILLAP